jgi:hypothetical protein
MGSESFDTHHMVICFPPQAAFNADKEATLAHGGRVGEFFIFPWSSLYRTHRRETLGFVDHGPSYAKCRAGSQVPL